MFDIRKFFYCCRLEKEQRYDTKPRGERTNKCLAPKGRGYNEQKKREKRRGEGEEERRRN
jgi:hypothetical protein